MWVFFPLGFRQWHSCWPSSCATEFHLSRDLMIAGMSSKDAMRTADCIFNKKTSLAVLSQRLRSENVLRSEQVRHRVHDSFTQTHGVNALICLRKKAVKRPEMARGIVEPGKENSCCMQDKPLLVGPWWTLLEPIGKAIYSVYFHKFLSISCFSAVPASLLFFFFSSAFFLFFFCFSSASLLFYRFFVFLLFLLFRFSASLLFRFFALPASQLFCFSAFVLSCSSFFSCVFFIFCFSCFSAFLLLRFFALPASLLFCFFVFLLFSCFILSCLYLKWSPRDETQQHPKDIPTNTLNETLNKAAIIP